MGIAMDESDDIIVSEDIAIESMEAASIAVSIVSMDAGSTISGAGGGGGGGGAGLAHATAKRHIPRNIDNPKLPNFVILITSKCSFSSIRRQGKLRIIVGKATLSRIGSKSFRQVRAPDSTVELL